MIRYELLNVTDHAIEKKIIDRAIKNAEEKLGNIGERHIVIEVVTPKESAKLNHELRDKKEPTDIISVSSIETRIGEQVITESPNGSLHFTLDKEQYIGHDWPILGQLILCYEIIESNATQARQPVERELEWVIEHGILHLLGFHHDEK